MSVNLYNFLRTLDRMCTILFVMGGKAIDKNIQFVFGLALSEFPNTKLQIVSEQEVKKLNPMRLDKKKDFFVFGQFDIRNVAYMHVRNHATLFGTPLIFAALKHKNVVVDLDRQTFSDAFKGLILCLDDNLRLTIKDDLEGFISMMSGTLELSLDGATHFLTDHVHGNIGTSGRASKYWIAHERGLPICHAGWVEYVLKELILKPFLGEFKADNEVFSWGMKLPIFSALRVCGQFLQESVLKEQIKIAINQNGGYFVPEITNINQVDVHLFVIEANATDEAIRGALYLAGKSGRHLVNDLWFHDSVQSEKCQKFENYTVRRSLLDENSGNISDSNFSENFENPVPGILQSSLVNHPAPEDLNDQELPPSPQLPEPNLAVGELSSQQSMDVEDHRIDNQAHQAPRVRERQSVYNDPMELEELSLPNEPAQQASQMPQRRRVYKHICNIAGCDKSFKDKNILEDHRINEHGLGMAFLCACGYVATGPSRKKAHQESCRKLSQNLRGFFMRQKARDDNFKEYSFTHVNTILVRTTHPVAYPQIVQNKQWFIEKYVSDNIEKLKQNQRRYNQLHRDGTKEIESDDELHF